MKKKVGELYDKPIVVGDSNELQKGEILLKNSKHGITLSERKDGELEDIGTTPTYPRCFIWYDLGDEGDIGEPFPLHTSVRGNSMFTSEFGNIYSNVILFENKYIFQNDKIIDVDLFLNKHKGKYKEISLKEYMGECPEGNFGIIRIPTHCDPSGQVIYGLLEDKFSKKRINYLKSNIENKYNTIRLYGVEGGDNGYYYVNVKSYTIDKENNCIVFEIEPLPPFGMVTQIKVSLDAEVVE